MKLSFISLVFLLVCGLTISIYISIMSGLSVDEKKWREKCKKIVEKLRENVKIEDDVFLKFPKYYINLDRSRERRQKMEEEFKTYGIENIERVSACDGKTLKKTGEGNFEDLKFVNQFENLTLSEIAITCSHLKAIRNAWRRGLEIALIMEDDVTFSIVPHWKIKFKDLLKSVSEDADIVLLTHVGNTEEKKLFNRRKDQNAAVCYLVTKKGMDRVMKDFFRNGEVFLGKDSGLENSVIDTGIWSYLDTYYVDPRMFPVDGLFFDSTHYKGISGKIYKENHKILEKYFDEDQKGGIDKNE